MNLNIIIFVLTMDIGRYYYFYEMEKKKEQDELRKNQKKYISDNKQKIDDLLLNCNFETAFEHLIVFLISVEPKDVPYILQHYDNLIKKHKISKLNRMIRVSVKIVIEFKQHTHILTHF